MTNRRRTAFILASCLACVAVVANAQQIQAQTKTSTAAAAAAHLKNPSPELVGNLTKELSITPEQAIGGSGALFGLAKTRLNPEEFTKVAGVVPGMDGLLKAAPKPKPKKGAAGALDAVGGMLPGKAGSLASVASSFQSLGLSPEQMIKFVPVMTQFVNLKGGAGIADMLSGVLK
ncbi:MAG: DUF2780 domain-containing protein [Pyrinomonadaceae bacterium]